MAQITVEIKPPHSPFFFVSFTMHPPKSDDWKWSTEKGAFIIE